MGQLYVSIDGDDIGARIEYLILTNSIDKLSQFSDNYETAMNWFVKSIREAFRAKVVFTGGDNSLIVLDEEDFSLAKLNELRTEFIRLAGQTLSIGVGHSPREAYLALKLSKSGGKNRIHLFEDLISA